MMKLTKEQKATAIADLAQLFGVVKLQCDGFEVTLRVERFKGFKYRVMTYVNGKFDGSWVRESSAAPEAKFLRKSTTPNLSAAKRVQAEKSMGKRYVSKHPFWGGSTTLFLPDWGSGRAAINHLCKMCQSVELIKSESLLDELKKDPVGATSASAAVEVAA